MGVWSRTAPCGTDRFAITRAALMFCHNDAANQPIFTMHMNAQATECARAARPIFELGKGQLQFLSDCLKRLLDIQGRTTRGDSSGWLCGGHVLLAAVVL